MIDHLTFWELAAEACTTITQMSLQKSLFILCFVGECSLSMTSHSWSCSLGQAFTDKQLHELNCGYSTQQSYPIYCC